MDKKAMKVGKKLKGHQSKFNGMRDRINKSDFKDYFGKGQDFSGSYMLPSDDIFGDKGSAQQGYMKTFHQFKLLAERRVGIAYRVLRKPANDAIRNEFEFRNYEEDIVEREDIFKYYNKTNLAKHLADCLFYERTFGIGTLMLYFTENDKDKDLSEPPPDKKPIGFQAFPPTLMVPQNQHRTSWLDTNPQEWKMSGGKHHAKTNIHEDRVWILRTRKASERWWGTSVIEPVWIPLMSYFQAQIYMLKAFAKMGNTIPIYKIDTEGAPLLDVYNEYADMLEEMSMNGMWIGTANDEIKIVDTKIGRGMREMMECWIEDVAAGTNFPKSIILGRAVSNGIGGTGHLVAERNYWNEIANIQYTISEPLIDLFKLCRFNGLDELRIAWNLAINKTKQQKLIEEGIAIENALMREDLIQKQAITDQIISGEIDITDEEEEQEQQRKREIEEEGPKQEVEGDFYKSRRNVQIKAGKEDIIQEVRREVRKRRRALMYSKNNGGERRNE